MRLAGILGFGAVAVIALSSCNSETAEPPLYGPGSSAGLQACPRIYTPVCAARSGDRRTFPNECEAQEAGYRIRYDGECAAGGVAGQPPIGGPVGGPGTIVNPEQSYPVGGGSGGGDQVCAKVYKPVCGKLNGDTRTFPNSCLAASAGYQVTYHSECVGGVGAPATGSDETGPGAADNGAANDNGGDSSIIQVGPSGGTDTGTGDASGTGTGGASAAQQASTGAGSQESCSRSFVPVCGAKDGKNQTFINACMAKARGFSVASQGRCK